MAIVGKKNTLILSVLLDLFVASAYADTDQTHLSTTDHLQPHEVLVQQYQMLKASTESDPLLLKETGDLLSILEQKPAPQPPRENQIGTKEPVTKQQEEQNSIEVSDESIQFAALGKEIDFLITIFLLKTILSLQIVLYLMQSDFF